MVRLFLLNLIALNCPQKEQFLVDHTCKLKKSLLRYWFTLCGSTRHTLNLYQIRLSFHIHTFEIIIKRT